MVIEKRYLVDTTSKRVIKSRKKAEKALKTYFSDVCGVSKKDVKVVFGDGLIQGVAISCPPANITIYH